MRKGLSTLLTIATLFVLASCQKEVTGQLESSGQKGDSSFEGNYKFESLEAHTKVANSVLDGTDIDKTVTVSDYITKNNTGTVKIDASTMTSSNFSYEIDTVMTSILYINNVMIDSASMPLQLKVPMMNNTSSYQKVTSDSLYFPNGFIITNNATFTTTGIGVKLRQAGNKLYMDMTHSDNFIQDVQGEQVHTAQTIKATITLQRM